MSWAKTRAKEGRLRWLWCNMKQRCYNKNNCHYENYMARGIEVCKEWKDNYNKFKEWALSHGYSDNLTLDRKDVDGNYEPNNCRWVTQKEQNRNRRCTVYLTIGEIKKPLSQWCEELGLRYRREFDYLSKHDEETLIKRWRDRGHINDMEKL